MENTMKTGMFRAVLKRTGGILVIPAICYLLMEIACRISGTALFTGGSTWQLFFRGLAYVLLLSYGVSINMQTGRFDFSAGAVMLIGGVCGAQIAVAFGLGPVPMLLISAAVGAVFGGITGFFYVILRLSPMIIGLGMTLVLEGVVAILTDGCKPVGFGTDASYYRFAVSPLPMVVTLFVALFFMLWAFHYTRFGYDYRALQSGQKIAVSAGINEQKNAILCYTLAGLLLGGAGALSICSTNGITPTINFSTIASIFGCFLPIFFSGFIEKFCNKQIAVLIGCVSYELIQIGFGQIGFVNASFTVDVYRVVEALILVIFLIYLNNEKAILDTVTLRRYFGGKNHAPTPMAEP